MLFSGVSSVCVVTVVALLNSDNAVLSELTEVSRQIHSAGSRLSKWQASSAVRAIGVVPDGPLCPYCSGGTCRVCHDTCFAYDEACGSEGKIVGCSNSPSEALVAATSKAMTAVVAAVERIRVAAADVLAYHSAGVSTDPDCRMGCDFLPDCDFGWTAEPDTIQPDSSSFAGVKPSPPEPPADDEGLTPAPVAPAIASQAGPDPFDHLFEPAPTPTPALAGAERSNAIRPVLYMAANLLAHLSDAADKASERLYYLAGDEAPQDGD